jgi:hypothetical protein
VGGMGLLGGAACVAATCYGFGAAGIVGGSSAAALQASISNVVVGSAFATAQSLGATGWFVTGAYAGAATAGVGGATAATAASQPLCTIKKRCRTMRSRPRVSIPSLQQTSSLVKELY